MDVSSLEAFTELIATVAKGWMTQRPELALACFSPEAVYLEPPDIQLFIGHDQLRPYFAAVPAGTEMTIHRVWFDPVTQTGSFEYTFAGPGRQIASHGMTAISLVDGRIQEWCEFQREGPRAWRDFRALAEKNWRWTAENYPPRTTQD
jgi:hypothetical protein